MAEQKLYKVFQKEYLTRTGIAFVQADSPQDALEAVTEDPDADLYFSWEAPSTDDFNAHVTGEATAEDLEFITGWERPILAVPEGGYNG